MTGGEAIGVIGTAMNRFTGAMIVLAFFYFRQYSEDSTQTKLLVKFYSIFAVNVAHTNTGFFCMV